MNTALKQLNHGPMDRSHLELPLVFLALPVIPAGGGRRE